MVIYNKLEAMPREIMYNGKFYFLEVVVTAWGKLCVQYREMNDRNDKILPYVVEPENAPYIPTLIAATETSGLNEHIGNCKTLDECLNAIEDKIMEMGLLKDLQEWEARPKVGDVVQSKLNGRTFTIGIVTTEGEYLSYMTGLSKYKEQCKDLWFSEAKTLEGIEKEGYLLENEIVKSLNS